MKFRKAAATVALLCATVAFSFEARAVSIDRTVAGSGQWDYVFFSVTSAGSTSIDILGNGWTGGPTGTGLDDSWIEVFTNNGSPIGALTGTQLGFNDDSVGFADGSTSVLDSFLSLNLGVGNYILAVAHCCFFDGSGTTSDGRTATNSGVHSPYLDYRVTFSENVSLSVVPGPIVGAGLPGLALAFGGFLAWRRRRQQVSSVPV